MSDIMNVLRDVKSGNVEAMRIVAHYVIYEEQKKEPRASVITKCLEYLQAASDAGDPDAMLDLGGMYMMGRGVEEDQETAYLWYEKAAEKMHPMAFYRIGQWYLYDDDTDGKGFLSSTKDPERIRKAYDYFMKGAVLGVAGCMNELGIMFMNGEAGFVDKKTGFRLFSRAYAEKDSVVCISEPCEIAHAAYYLTQCFHYGEGAKKDLLVALILAKEALEMEKCEYEEGRCESDYFVRRAAGEIRKIAEEMQREPTNFAYQYELGELYMGGIGVEKNLWKAFSRYYDAYMSQDAEPRDDRILRVEFRLAQCFHYGLGAEVDIREAFAFMIDYWNDHAELTENGVEINPELEECAGKEWDLISEELNESRKIEKDT